MTTIPNFEDDPESAGPFTLDEGYLRSAPMTLARTGKRSYVARSEAGGEVRIGGGLPGEFTPGELLKIALAACNAMSADARIIHALGTEDFESEIVIETLKNEAEERYEQFQVTLHAPIAHLDDDARAQLEERAERSVTRYCTVGRTLEFGPSYEFRLQDL